MSTMPLTCVLLPGLDGTGQLFSRMIPRLSQHFNVSTIRYPPGTKYSYDETAQ